MAASVSLGYDNLAPELVDDAEGEALVWLAGEDKRASQVHNSNNCNYMGSNALHMGTSHSSYHMLPMTRRKRSLKYLIEQI